MKGMDGFTFYGEYYETIKKVKKLSDKQAVLMAMLEFVFDGKEPQGLSEVAEIVFEMFRKNLTKSKNKSNNARNKTKSNENQTKNKSKSNGNKSNESKNLISFDFERESPPKESPDERSPLNEKERSKEKENIYPQESYPQENTPQETVQRTRARVGTDGRTVDNRKQREFFELYPKINIDNYSPSEYAGIDFELLMRRFEESSFLRSRQSFSWICKNYPKIAAGEYKDFDKRKKDGMHKNELGPEWADLE